jgi:hypothetical protein
MMNARLLLCVFGVVLTGCAKSPPASPPSPPPSPSLVGSWQSPDGERQILFNSDKTFSTNWAGGQYAFREDGTWEIANGELRLSIKSSSANGTDLSQTDPALKEIQAYICKVSDDGRALDVKFSPEFSARLDARGSVAPGGSFFTNANEHGPWIFRRL